MLLALSVSFLVMVLPINVVMLIGTLWNSTEQSPEDYSTINLVRTIAELLMYTHHATNFILYFCTGSQFRRHFRETFFKKRESKKKKETNEHHNIYWQNHDQERDGKSKQHDSQLDILPNGIISLLR
jgi:hypothetical protein